MPERVLPQFQTKEDFMHSSFGSVARFAVAALAVAGAAAQAQVVRIGESAFTAAAGRITFSEVSLGTVNPIYQPVMYGGGAGAPTVTFGGWLWDSRPVPSPVARAEPQSAVASSACRPARSRSMSRRPIPSLRLTAPIRLPPCSPAHRSSTGPCRSCSAPIWRASDSRARYFDAVGGTSIRAFDRAGAVIGSVANTGLAIEFLGLVTSDGLAHIAGCSSRSWGRSPLASPSTT